MVLDTKAEHQVLADLMEYPGWVFTKEQNYQTVYQEQAESIVNVVMCLVHSIRNKTAYRS